MNIYTFEIRAVKNNTTKSKHLNTFKDITPMYKNAGNSVKDGTVETPPFLAEYFYKTDLSRKQLAGGYVLDIGCYRGNLSDPYRKKKGVKVLGVDIDDTHAGNFDHFIHEDFLKLEKSNFEGLPVNLVVCNAPFGKEKSTGQLWPDLIADKVFQLFGDKIPFLLIAGAWYLTNSSKRMEKLNRYPLTKTYHLHKTVFQDYGVSVESAALLFNIKTKKAHDFVKYEKTAGKKHKKQSKTVAFTHEQLNYIESNISNFSGAVKAMIKKEYPDFPV